MCLLWRFPNGRPGIFRRSFHFLLLSSRVLCIASPVCLQKRAAYHQPDTVGDSLGPPYEGKEEEVPHIIIIIIIIISLLLGDIPE